MTHKEPEMRPLQIIGKKRPYGNVASILLVATDQTLINMCLGCGQTFLVMAFGQCRVGFWEYHKEVCSRYKE